jgi:hypothetical protein
VITRRGTGSLDTIAVAATASGGHDSDDCRRHDHEPDRQRSDLVDVPLELAQRREHRRRPQDGRQEDEEDEIRVERWNRDAGDHPDAKAREHLKNRRRYWKAARECGERDHEHRNDDREDDGLKVHCEW